MHTFSQVVEGYNLHAQARKLSTHTMADYNNTFWKFAAFLGIDAPFDKINKSQIESFFVSQNVCKKTILNYHTGLSALWRWAVEEGYTFTNLPRQIEPPRPEIHSINPLSESDIQDIVKAISTSKSYQNHGTTTTNRIPNKERNRAIIMLLLDTGIRADELCSLTIQDVDLKNRIVHVINGKGDKERFVPFCPKTAQELWKYVSTRKNINPTDKFFVTLDGCSMDRHRLLKQLQSLGRRAGVANVHPHRFRHTFSIFYLRNGGDPYSLQMMLGHTTMQMTKRYLEISRSDLEGFHRKASPVANMRI